MTPEIKNLILDLYSIGAIKFGSFTLKSGLESPIYIDLRLVISYPHLMKNLSTELHKISSLLKFDMLCGVPYAALPFATALSLEGNYPMIMCRKEVKDYGTKKLIEGNFQKKQTCLLIEDVITFGTSILETATALRNSDLKVSDVIVLLDRKQGGRQKLKESAIELHALLNVLDLLQVLFEEDKISEETFKDVNTFLENSIK